MSEREWLAVLLRGMDAGQAVLGYGRCGHRAVCFIPKGRDYAEKLAELGADPCTDCMIRELEA